MVRKLIPVLAAFVAFATGPSFAQTSGNAQVVVSCGSASYTAGRSYPVTQDTTGDTCTSSSGGGGGTVTANQGTPNAGGGSNAWPIQGAGTAGTPAGGVVSIQGVTSGQAVPISGTVTITPSGTQSVNTAQVNGATVNVGTGAAGTGTQRVTTSTDSTIGTVSAVTAITNALPAGTNIIGKASIDQTTPGTTNGVQTLSGSVTSSTQSPSSASTAGVAPVSSTALEANHIIKASSGNLYDFQVSADSTLSAAAWWVMIYNATSAPADGAVTPVKCYAMVTGATTLSGAFPFPAYFSTGITIGVSTTGCFTKTASAHAFISGDVQ